MNSQPQDGLSSVQSRTTFYKVPTMRRMMHAAVFIALLASGVQAQNSSFKALPALPASEQSILVAPQAEIAQWNDADESPTHPVGIHHGAGNVNANPIAPANETIPHAAIADAPELVPYGYARPYSQLASYMNCSNVSPCLWHNYAKERAAIAACIMRHVDGQCSCFSGQCKLHAQACEAGCSQGACQSSCSSAKINRYREPMSTFYDSPSSICGKTGCNVLGKNKPSCPPSNCTSGDGSVLFPTHAGNAVTTSSNLYGVATSPTAKPLPTTASNGQSSGRFASPSFGNAPVNNRLQR